VGYGRTTVFLVQGGTKDIVLSIYWQIVLNIIFSALGSDLERNPSWHTTFVRTVSTFPTAELLKRRKETSVAVLPGESRHVRFQLDFLSRDPTSESDPQPIPYPVR
jgi:hypothetical protein